MNKVRIGVLHSLTGTMANNEKYLVAAMQMAIDEINSSRGVLGCQVEMLTKDCESDPDKFATQAEILIRKENISTIFGCWTSSSRKAVKPIVEQYNSILWYPVQYEGLEQSPNIIYTGSCLNQQIEPAVQWEMSKGKRRCFLLGSDYVFPRTANSLLRQLIQDGGGTILNEQYVPMGSRDFEDALKAIKALQPQIIYNTINGDSNLSFFRELSQSGFDTDDCLVMSFSFSEIELQDVANEAAGSYACWSYFSSLQTPENLKFLRKYYKLFGDNVPVSDPIATAYTQMFLWKYLVEDIGTFDCQKIQEQMTWQSVIGPCGLLEIQANHHVKKYARIGKATLNGQFDIVWSSESLIVPKPWLGIEETELKSKSLIVEAMNLYPEMSHLNWRLNKEIENRRRIEDERKRLIEDLQNAMLKVKLLSGLLPMCSSCKKIRDDKGYWTQIEDFLREHSEAEFTHSYCPACAKKLFPDIWEE